MIIVPPLVANIMLISFCVFMTVITVVATLVCVGMAINLWKEIRYMETDHD